MNNKKKALAKYLGIDEDQLVEESYDHYGLTVFSIKDDYGEYAVATDEEADIAVGEYIEGSLWAFNTDFIIEHTDLPYEAGEMIEAFKNSKCETANETIAALIKDMDEFIEDAIDADGRGHFLSPYDGEEHEVELNGKTYYIYRVN